MFWWLLKKCVQFRVAISFWHFDVGIPDNIKDLNCLFNWWKEPNERYESQLYESQRYESLSGELSRSCQGHVIVKCDHAMSQWL